MQLIPAPVAFGLFFLVIVVNRILQERALRKLSTEQKGQLVEAFSGYRMTALIPVAAIAGLYMLMTQLEAVTTAVMLAVYIPAVLVFSLVLQVFVYRKLRTLKVDPEYLRVYVIGRGLMAVAFATMLLAF
jgi:hypothetical protein